MVNKLILGGRLVKDPEMRLTSSNSTIAFGTIAFDSRNKNADGEYPTNYIDFKAFGDLGDKVVKQARKGDKVEICARLEMETFETQHGTKITRPRAVIESIDIYPKKEEKPEDKPAKKTTAPVMDTSNLDSLELPDEDLPF